MATSQSTAQFFRVIYIILFVFSGLLVITNIDSAMFDFTKLFEILDYLTLFIQEGVRMMGGVAYGIALALLSTISRIPIIGDAGVPNTGDISTMLSGILDPLNSFYPHSTIIIDPLNIILDFFIFFGATAILILIPIAFAYILCVLEGEQKEQNGEVRAPPKGKARMVSLFLSGLRTISYYLRRVTLKQFKQFILQLLQPVFPWPNIEKP